MATKPFGVWGIDLGQCALKALRMEISEDGNLVATAFDYVEHPKILSQPDADPDQLTREALEKFLSRNTLRGDQVAISVPGQSGLARFVKLPPVEEKKIGDIVRFEAKQQIPFNLEEVVWDYQKIGSGAVTDGFAMETEIGLFAMKRDMVNRYLQHFKDVNVEVHIVQMAPLALCNFVAYDLLGKNEGQEAADPEATTAYGKKQCVVALDIGADSSNLIITDGGRIIWQRPIPLGGNHFTRALTKDMKLTFAKAEHLKRNATKSPDLKQILSSLKPVLNDFVGEVQRSLGYFTNTHRDANILYMVGLGNAFRLPGLQRFLSEKLQIEVRKLGKLERLVGDSVVTAPAYTENVLSYGVAYGLALQGLHQAHLKTNLLPPEIQLDRMVRGKKPWAAAAAAALLLGGAAVAFSYALEVRAYGGAQKDDENKENVVVKAKGKGKKVVDTAKEWDTKFGDQVKKAEKEERDVKSIIAGQDERENWLKLQQFVSSVLPYPEVHIQTNQAVTNKHLELANLPLKDAQGVSPASKYIKPEADYAFEVFKRKQEMGTSSLSANPADGKEPGKESKVPDFDDATIKDLIQVNIESVDTRYTDDLAAVWNAIKNSSSLTEGRVRPASQYKEAPKEKDAGWVVELRGYTFHDGKDLFIVDALLENIARKGMPASAATPAPASGKDATASTAAPTTPAPAGGNQPADKKEASPKPAEKSADQVLGQISHAVLYKVSDNASGGSMSLGSALSTVMTGTGSAPAGDNKGYGQVSPSGSGGGESAKGGGLGGGGGGARGSWRPLGSGGGAFAGGGGGKGGAGIGETGSGPRGMPGFVSTGPPSSVMGGVGTAVSKGGGVSQPGIRKRTEFIVFFFWREPTPSDKLRSMQEGGGGGGATGPGGFPGTMPGYPGGAGLPGGGTRPPAMSGPPGGG